MKEALLGCDMSVVWRLSRRRASPFLGSRNRCYSRLQSCKPSLDERRTSLARSGFDGGCGAGEVDINDAKQQEDPPLLSFRQSVRKRMPMGLYAKETETIAERSAAQRASS